MTTTNTATQGGFRAYVITGASKTPIFASHKHCFFTTMRQAQNKLWSTHCKTNSLGIIIDRSTGEQVWSIAL
jgi:hypothetical protein